MNDSIKPYQMKPGTTLNPNGRPKGSRSISSILKEMLEQVSPEKIRDAKFVQEFLSERKKNVTNADAIAARLYYNAIVKGDNKSINDIMERTEGKVPFISKVEAATDIKVVWQGDIDEAGNNPVSTDTEPKTNTQ